MLKLLLRLFATEQFMPHGMCYLWNPTLLRLHLISDLFIGLAYVVIAISLVFFVRLAKQYIPFSWIFLGFGTFILACGATHFLEIWTLWIPVYWLSGVVKLTTATASVLIAIVLPPLVPKSLAVVRSAQLSEGRRAELEQLNRELQMEVGERRAAEALVQQLNADLAQRVGARTLELGHVTEELARLAEAVRNLDEPVKTINREGHLTGWNTAAERLFGYGKDEVLGKPAVAFVPPALRDELTGLMARVTSGEQIIDHETSRKRKNGDLLYVSLTLTPVRNLAGQILGATILTRDITERRRAEEMFRIAVETAPNGLIMADAAGLIVMANPQVEKLFGYGRNELIGVCVDSLLPTAERATHPGRREEFSRHPKALSLGVDRDVHGLRKDGTEFSVEIGLHPIQTDQGMLVLTAIVDVTARKQAEAEIRRLNQDLEQRVEQRTSELATANRELEAFSYSVAHDLRGPLRSIDGFSQALIDDYSEKLDAQGNDFLHRVRAATKRMSGLIDDLLSLSRVARSDMHKEEVDLSVLAASVLQELRRSEPQRSVEFVVTGNLFASADSRLMRIVFENLIGNAWKYSSRRAHARIEFGLSTNSAGRAAFFVRDDGAGFDPRYAARLFGAFQRLHSAAEFSGTGVGLATVQRILHRHGGDIWAEAAVEKGATFFFTLSNESKAENS